jgi:hypothetical protein
VEAVISPVAKGLTFDHAALAPPDSALRASLYSKPKGEAKDCGAFRNPSLPPLSTEYLVTSALYCYDPLLRRTRWRLIFAHAGFWPSFRIPECDQHHVALFVSTLLAPLSIPILACIPHFCLGLPSS